MLFIIFQLYPLIWSFVLGFYKWNGLTNKVFVGLSNYRQLMGDQQFWTTMENTLWYVLANILITLPISVLLGMLLCSRGLKCGRAYKTFLVLLMAVLVHLALDGCTVYTVNHLDTVRS